MKDESEDHPRMMQLMEWDRPESKLDCQYGKQVSYEDYLKAESTRITSAPFRPPSNSRNTTGKVRVYLVVCGSLSGCR